MGGATIVDDRQLYTKPGHGGGCRENPGVHLASFCRRPLRIVTVPVMDTPCTEQPVGSAPPMRALALKPVRYARSRAGRTVTGTADRAALPDKGSTRS